MRLKERARSSTKGVGPPTFPSRAYASYSSAFTSAAASASDGEMETEKQRGAVVCIGRGGGGAGASGARVPTASLALKPRIDAIATGAKQSAEAEADSFGCRKEVEKAFAAAAAVAVAADGESGDVGEGLLQAEGPSTCRVTTLKGCGLEPREEPSPAMTVAAGGGIGFALLVAPLVF